MKHGLKAAEGSKLLKATLAREFPGTKFSVRMSRGTAYGSIDIRYENGPSFEDVDAIASGFEGKSFDGSIMCRAPRGCTTSLALGKACMNAPAPPAWSR